MDQRKKLIRDLAYLMSEGQEINREVMQYEPWYPDTDQDIPWTCLDMVEDDWSIPKELSDQEITNRIAREELCSKLRICCKNQDAYLLAYNEAYLMSCGIHELKTASA